MSIVVTCSCSRTYRLPDRYAGKKARCRDCGEPIEVPTQEDDAVEKPAQKRKKGESRSSRSKADRKADKAEKARDATRRLNSQDREIIGERRNLRASDRKRPISESMHQLAPIALSGDRLDMSPTPPSTSRSRPNTKKKTKREVQESKKKAKEQARSARDAEERKAARKDKKKKKKRRSSGSAKDETKAQKKAAKARTTKLIQGPEGPSRAPTTKKAEKGKTAKRPLSGVKARERAAKEVELDEAGEPLPQDLVSKLTRLPVPALLGIAAALCLGIGLIVGGLVGGGPKSPAEDKRVVKLQQLVNERKWVEAKAELEVATMATKGHGDELVAAHVRALGRTVGPMAMIMELPDAGARMRVLADNIAVPDAMVRKAIAVELCDMADEDKAQAALQLLAKDLDPRVAEAAKKGLRAGFKAEEPEAAPAAPAAKAPAEAPKGE